MALKMLFPLETSTFLMIMLKPTRAFLVTVFFGFALQPGFSETLILTGTVRDFLDTHPDFENGIGVDPGIVQSTLGSDKKPVYAGETGNPTTHGETAFNQWYRDVSGVNMSKPLSITLDNTITADPDVFTYANSSFFPIDGELFGNEGRSHNYHFTFELHTSFTYLGGETFSFTGDDDLWVFINDSLAIDLGGVHGALSQSVSLDDLGLTTGEDYDLDLFFAERHTTASNFRIDTSLRLRTQEPDPETVPDSSSAFLLMTIALAGLLAGKPLMRRSRDT